jgi:hypothetical protein
VNAGKVEVKSAPDADSQTVSTLYEDAVVVWIKEVTGANPYRTNQRYVETPDGYIWAPTCSRCGTCRMNRHRPCLKPAWDSVSGWRSAGLPWTCFWITPARSPALQDRIASNRLPRLYYSQITWVDRIKADEDGQVWYRINGPYGSYGDLL